MKNLKIPQLRLHLLQWVLMCTAATACWSDSMAQTKTDNDSKLVNKIDTLQKNEKARDTAFTSNLVYGVNVAFGTRFSFLDSQASNDLYYDISCFIPTFGRLTGRRASAPRNMVDSTKGPMAGIDFGMLEQGPQAISPDGNSNATVSHNYTIVNQVEIVNPWGGDSVSVLHRAFTRTRTLDKSTGVSVYAAPTLRVSDKVYGLIHFQHDFSRQLYTLSDESIQTTPDTISYLSYLSSIADANSSMFRSVSSFGSSEAEEHTTMKSFAGIGAIFIAESGPITYRFKPVLGGQYARYTANGDRTIQVFDTISFHYMLDFRIIETKKIGFKIGGLLSGDIRLPTKGNGHNFDIYSGSPFIYLAKVWDIDKLMDFLNAGSPPSK